MARSGEGESFAVLGPPGVKPVVNSIFDFSAAALAELRLWLEQNPPAIGISNILGFSQFTAQASGIVTTAENSASTGYTNLATDGPSLVGLPDGKYVVFVTAWASSNNAAFAAYTSVSVNGAAPSDNDAAISDTQTFQSVLGVSLQTLAAGGNNSLKIQYRVANAAATGTWANRRLIALRYANK